MKTPFHMAAQPHTCLPPPALVSAVQLQLQLLLELAPLELDVLRVRGFIAVVPDQDVAALFNLAVDDDPVRRFGEEGAGREQEDVSGPLGEVAGPTTLQSVIFTSGASGSTLKNHTNCGTNSQDDLSLNLACWIIRRFHPCHAS